MGTAAVFIESYLFPLLFLYYIYAKFQVYRFKTAETMAALQQFIGGDWSIPVQTIALGAVNDFFVVLLDVAIIYSLIVRRNLKSKPQGFLEIVIPLLATFFYLAYNWVDYLPDRLNAYFLPDRYMEISFMIGAGLNIIGALISFIAVFNLRHSYGIFVQMREIKTNGLYRFVRHPIYLGYLFSFIGLVFIQPCMSYVILLLISLILTVYRAILEEKKLMAAPEYQEYARQTPFMVPWFVKASS
jgi:protein-S-isoprenylcysteine O-methyltransferase Ste14